MPPRNSSYAGGAPSKIVTDATCMCEGWLSSRWRNEESSADSRSFAMPGIVTRCGSERQGELRRVGHRRRDLLVEAGHADSQEPHRARRGEGAEEIEGDPHDHGHVIGRL